MLGIVDYSDFDVFQTVCDYFSRKDERFNADEEKLTVELKMYQYSFPVTIRCSVIPQKKRLIIESPMIYKAENKTVNDTCRALMQLNYNLELGYYTIDIRSGLLSYKASVDYTCCEVDNFLCDYIFVHIFNIIERNNETLFYIATGQKTYQECYDANSFADTIREYIPESFSKSALSIYDAAKEFFSGGFDCECDESMLLLHINSNENWKYPSANLRVRDSLFTVDFDNEYDIEITDNNRDFLYTVAAGYTYTSKDSALIFDSATDRFILLQSKLFADEFKDADGVFVSFLHKASYLGDFLKELFAKLDNREIGMYDLIKILYKD
ncbi:MAG: hypothetical protein IJR60_02575 [Eubacterium sp.]|nr:hypothetical protein [Eubacterium sp.]